MVNRLAATWKLMAADGDAPGGSPESRRRAKKAAHFVIGARLVQQLAGLDAVARPNLYGVVDERVKVPPMRAR